MKYGDYHLPSGVDFSSITYEDIRWQYGVFRCNSTGSGRDKRRFPWDGVKTNLGEIEEKDWNTIISGHQPLNCEKKPFSYTLTGFSTIRNGAATFLSIRDTVQKSGEPLISYMCGTNAAIRFPPLHKSRSTMHTTGQSPAHTAEDGVNSSFWESGFSRSHWFPA